MSKYRVGIYLRLSDEDNNKINKLDNSESIKNQRFLLLEEIGRHDDFVLYDEYCDENISGAGTYRPEFERLIRDCEHGKIDIVMCKSQSRFSRDMEIVEKYINNKFREWNIRFIGLSDNADTDNYGNKKARQINGLVNEWYLEDVSNNIRSAFMAKMKVGEFISPFAMYGYRIDDNDNNKLVIDDNVSNIVKMIFTLFLNGYSISGICRYLNGNNISSPSLYKFNNYCKLNIVSNKKRCDIKWNITTIRNILSNEVYIGNLIQGKRTTVSYKNHKVIKKDTNKWIRVNNTHDAIIDKDTFYRVQDVLKNRCRKLKNKSTTHIFSGIVFCFDCGSIFRKKNSSRYQYLVCSNCNCFNKRSIRYDYLEEIIINSINKFINNYYDFDILKNLIRVNYINIEVSKLNKKKYDIVKYIDNNRFYLKKLYEDKVNNKINDKYFDFLFREYNTLIDNYNTIVMDIDYKINRFDNFDYSICKCNKIDKLNRFIINSFISKIYIGNCVDDNREIKIIWNFSK